MKFATIIRAICVLSHRLLMAWRWIWYNLRAFIWFSPAPISTRFYGRVTFSHLPVRIKLGNKVSIGEDNYFGSGSDALIIIGEGSSLNRNCIIVASERIVIGSNVAIADGVSIRDQEHRFCTRDGIRGTGYKIEPVYIGDNSWIGSGAFIGPGVVIGRGCIVGAHSVVNGQFPDNVLIAGAPAVVKKHLLPLDGVGILGLDGPPER